MKLATDPRHQRRIILVRKLFTYSFHQETPKELKPILAHLPQIDAFIKESAPEWPLNQVNRVDLSILRLAIHELLTHSIPKKVVVDEAVELAKEFGAESSPKFVNGVLGSVIGKIDSSQTKELPLQ